MEIVSYRIVKKQRSTTAFDGEGARLYGGRWNSKGIAMVYTSDSLALCSLEIFVHLPSYQLLEDYTYITVTFDSECVASADMVDGWDSRPASKISKVIGDNWIKENQSAVLKVPSVIMSTCYNYLININHPDFSQIKIGEPISLDFDTRLKK